VSRRMVCSLYPQGAVAAMLSPLSTGEPPVHGVSRHINTSSCWVSSISACAGAAGQSTSPHSKQVHRRSQASNLDNSSRQVPCATGSGGLSETATHARSCEPAMPSLYSTWLLFQTCTPQTRADHRAFVSAQANMATRFSSTLIAHDGRIR